MKIEGALLKKLSDAEIEIEEIEKEYHYENGETEISRYDVAKFPCGRDYIPLKFDDRIDEQEYLESSIEYFKFIKDYEAIWSPKLNVIECEIQPLSRFGAPARYLFKKLATVLGYEITNDEESVRYEFDKSENDITLSIGSASSDYAILSSLKSRAPRFDFVKRRPTLRIENINLSKHDKAKSILEKIGNSILFKLDLTANIRYKLAEDRDLRFALLRRKRQEIQPDKSFPNYEYDNEPMSLYWYAKSAIEMPLLQFLAFYQILEFYFPIFSQKDANNKIKSLIKDPRFNPSKESDISKIISAISYNKNQLGFGSELDQLKATLSQCINSDELREFIKEDEDAVAFFNEKRATKISTKKININLGKIDLVLEFAERIYEIRCRVVHTKISDKSYELLLPSSPELRYLIYDISILEFLTKKVLISSSRILKI